MPVVCAVGYQLPTRTGEVRDCAHQYTAVRRYHKVYYESNETLMKYLGTIKNTGPRQARLQPCVLASRARMSRVRNAESTRKLRTVLWAVDGSYHTSKKGMMISLLIRSG